MQLEALQANDGDCFLLRNGVGSSERLILVDGGSAGVYKKVLEKRLDQLRGGHPVLSLRLVVVSHIDADHITGILDMFKQMSDTATNGEQPRWEVASLWHNAFEDLVKQGVAAECATVTAAADGKVDVAQLVRDGLQDERAIAVVSSVKQGRELSKYAKAVTKINPETKGKLIVAPESGRRDIAISDSLTFTVVGPRQAELDNLRAEWEKSEKKHGTNESATAADYLNRTVPNLSSIVFLAEERGPDQKSTRILMTGDAGGDLILKGLEDAKLLDASGCIKVNVLKLQHHGSNHSVEEAFFRRVIADTYVISGNGKHGIPHMQTLGWLSAARSGVECHVYMTNRHLQDGGKDLTDGLDRFLGREAQEEPRHHYHFLEDGSLSIVVAG